MLNLSWLEILVIVVVAVVAIGPKELPTVMRGLGRLVRRAQYVRYAFSRQFEDFMKEQDLEELRGRGRAARSPDDGHAETAADEDESDLGAAAFETVNFEARRRAVPGNAVPGNKEGDDA